MQGRGVLEEHDLQVETHRFGEGLVVGGRREDVAERRSDPLDMVDLGIGRLEGG